MLSMLNLGRLCDITTAALFCVYTVCFTHVWSNLGDEIHLNLQSLNTILYFNKTHTTNMANNKQEINNNEGKNSPQ